MENNSDMNDTTHPTSCLKHSARQLERARHFET